MAFDSTEYDSGTISQINVTPLVDVMLVLLVIFMVAAPIMQQGVEVELPQATIAPIEGEGEQLVVSIDKDEKVYIGEGNLIEIAELGVKANAILNDRSDKQVFVRADHRVEYGTVMSVMASLRKAGIYKVGLITEPS